MVQIVSSAKNQYVKQAKSLAQKKFRCELGLFLAEGANLIKDMPKDVETEYVFTTKERRDETLRLFDENTTQIFVVSDDVMRHISDTVTPYGIIAVCKIPTTKFAMPSGNALLLDGVCDPGNIGTIFRTAAACGFCEIYLLDTADIYSPKVVRSTLGGLFKVKAYEVDEKQAIALADGLNSVALDMRGENIFKNKVESPTLFVLGSEAHGVRSELKEHVKNTYSLPMKNDIESLNVAVAAAIAMYQTISGE